MRAAAVQDRSQERGPPVASRGAGLAMGGAIRDSGAALYPLEQLFNVSPELLGTASLDGYFTLLNPSWRRVLGWSLEEMMAEPFVSFVHPDDVAATNVQAAKLAQGEGVQVIDFENRYRTRGGDYRWIKWVVTSAYGVLYFVASDVTERRAATTEHEHGTRIAKAIVESVADGLYVVDASGVLTFVNPAGVELLGYESADDLVGRSPDWLFQGAGTADAVEDSSLAQAHLTGRAFRSEDDEFRRRDGTVLAISCSSAPVDLGDGKGSVVAFRDITERKAREDRAQRELDALSWVGRIRDALDQDRLVVFAQPIVDLRSGETVEHELLVRIVSPDGEIIAPGTFLPVAEQHGLIGDIDRRVLELAVGYAAGGHRVAINVSADSISDPNLFGLVKAQLEINQIDPSFVVLEITETALIRHEGVAQTFIESVRRLGCGVALDDFGTGYGSFRYLKQLPVTHLKIDQEFVRDLESTATGVNRHVIQAIVALARGMGLKTVAEGVETEAARRVLAELNVDYAQGYLFAHPTSAEEVFGVTKPTPKEIFT